MSELTNNISYLKGLADGMKISEKSDEGKLITKLIEILSDAADEIETLWDHNDVLEARVDELEETTDDIADELDEFYDALEDASDDDYESWDDEDYDDIDDDDELFDMYDDDSEDLFEIQCPECGEDVIVDFDMLDDENNIVCPNCHESIELEFDVDDDEDDSDIDD